VPSAEHPALDAEGLLRRLTHRGVDFVVIGGIAAILHGSPRMTFDLDICFATDQANLEALGAVLTAVRSRLRGGPGDVPFVPDASTLRHISLLTLVTDLGELDVLARPDGAPAFSTLRAHADRYDLGDFSVLVASIEDLVAMKRAADRPKDRADVAELEALLRLRGA
jgi:hypothetical protein